MEKPTEKIPQPAAEETIDLVEYYHIIRRHKWLVIASLVIMVGLILFYNAVAIPVYQGSATLLIDKETPRTLISSERMDYESTQSESLTFFSHFELITSRPVIEKVIAKLKLDEIDLETDHTLLPLSPFQILYSNLTANTRLLLAKIIGSEKKEPLSPEAKMNRLYGSLKKHVIKVDHIEDTRLVKIDALTGSPALSAEIANAVARAYIDYNIDTRLKTSQNTISYLTDNLYDVKKNLEDAEKEFLAFKQQEKLISMEESQRVTVQKVSEFTNAYIEARNRRLELDSKLAKINEVLKSNKGIPHLRSLIENKIIDDLYTQLVNLEVQLSRLEETFKSKHPNIIQARTQISNIRNKLDAEINKELNNLKAERSVLLAKERVLQETVNDFQKESLEINKKEFQYNILKRNVEMNQKLYDILLARLKEADMSGNMDVSNIRVAETAVVPVKPVKPKKTLNLILGVIFGLIIGIGFSFAIEFFDRSISTEEDVKKHLGIPVLSFLPVIAMPKELQERLKKERARNEK
ncbi:MAG: GumC family protein [Deltaproteobacteria bacterium]|nr:GumC family protein [Deltaproteobacteria bacterium]